MKNLEEKLRLRKNQEPLFAYLYERIPFNITVVDRILLHICRDNYLQILYSYDIDTQRLLLKFYLEKEDYAKCILIRDTLLNHNKSTGSSLKIDI
ncbi:hypothetical protein SAMN04488514_10810 [Kriegella aquimaris]|uniref:Uncharacterized protein n=1 Tax=Kriegella aquimaris TaxID=192904 RepID=A0A1G9SKQ0_9FLAO|nr:hypothetical protein SAMN04488514_10810 [Kriegella aquimaris]